MSEKEYKNYDSPCTIQFAAAKLTKDPEVKEGEYGTMVRLTFVATSKNDRFSECWIDCNVSKYNAGAAQHLLKGDVIDLAEGRLALRKWGDNKENSSISMEQAELTMRPSLLADLKERGWDPSAGSDDKPAKKNKDKGKKDAGKGKPAANKGKPPAKKEVLEIPDEDEDEQAGDDNSDGDEE